MSCSPGGKQKENILAFFFFFKSPTTADQAFKVSNVSADDREKSLPQLLPMQRPINTRKASSVRVSACVCVCACVSRSPVITLHLGDIINICTGIYSATWNISWRLR